MKNQWGGKRENAGRKPTGRIRKTLWVTPEEFETLKFVLDQMRRKENG